MKVAIVILNWNGLALLKKYLPKVVALSGKSSIWVIDNASTDGSVRYIQKSHSAVNTVVLDKNYGYAGGYNKGLAQIPADLYCLLNSDVAVTTNWLDPVLELFKKHSQIGILQPKILDLKNKEYFEYAGAAGGYIDLLGYPYCRGRIFQSLEKDNGQYNQNQEIFWATGACLFIRSVLFNSLQGFDADYFAHQEEIDLCWRAKNKGWQVFYCGQSTVYHLGGSTLSNMNPKKTFLNFRNSLFTITKNVPASRIFPIIFTRLVLDGIAALRFLWQLKFAHFWAIPKAHFSFYYYFKSNYNKREPANYLQNYYAVKSIVWCYYVHGIKYFNKLVKH